MRVCTIIARNYWAHARVLASSVLEHHPDAQVTALVIDCDAATASAALGESFDVVCVDEIGLDTTEFHKMAGIYNVLELSTALKPWLLRALLSVSPEPVVYLDPDIELFTPIGEAWQLASEHGIVLTPHTVTLTPLDDYSGTELTILRSGVYNLGFIATSAASMDFLEWWAMRLRRDCLNSKSDGMFVDQRWVDLVSSYYDPYVLRDAGWNVAYWNLATRRVTRSDGHYEVNGQPLRLFHYSGFDPDRPDRLSQYLGDDPGNDLKNDEVLGALCANYAERLTRAGHRAHSRIRYPFDRTASGLRLDRRARRVYRDALLAAERHAQDEPPDPFDVDHPDAFERWLNEPGHGKLVSRYLQALYDEREDVQIAFPFVDSLDAERFLHWVTTTGAAHVEIPPQLVPGDVPGTSVGIDVSGYMAAENGVGEAARRYIDVFATAGVPHTVLTYRNTQSRQEVATNAHVEAAYDLNFVVVNADQLPTFVGDVPSEWTEGYTIGQWAWEVERFPEWMAASFVHVDEVWVCSEHAARAIRPHTDKPVLVIPPPVVPPRVRPMSRVELGLPEGFMFLFCFDFDSVFERKNPLGVIEAFRQAFPEPCGPQLVIKSVRGDAHPQQLATLRTAAEGRRDIHVVDGYLSADAQAALMSSCDAYVSLHRAEGFGFTLAEAMALGKPVIATGYSGNVDFMDETDAWLVPYTLVPIVTEWGPYPPDARWAEPDVGAASRAMREIVADPAAARERGGRAADDIAWLHSPQARAAMVLDRLEAIAALRHRWATPHGGRPWASVVHDAERRFREGHDVDTPARFGRISRTWRRVVLRLFRHFTEQQERVHRSLLDSVRDLETRLSAESATVRQLEAKIEQLQSEPAAPEADGDAGVVHELHERRASRLSE